MMMMKILLAGFAVFGVLAAQAQGGSPGITKDRLTIGSIQPLTGPAAPIGNQISKGMQLRVEEANATGGIHGRKLALLVEDHAYNPSKSVAAVEKMADRGVGIFALVGHFGSSNNIAAMPLQFERGIVNFLPVSAARQMYMPHHRLKFAASATYYDQMRIAAPRLVRQLGVQKACVLYQDDGFGQEVLQGAEAGLRILGMELAERVAYKSGASGFASEVGSLKAAGCQLVVLGTVTRETVLVMSEARNAKFDATFLGPNSVYGEQVPALGGKAVDGLYSAMTWQVPYLDAAEQPVREWAIKYKSRFGEEPGVLSVIGYQAVDAFVKAALKAGPNLSTDNFISVMETMTFRRDMFGGAEQNFSSTQRIGNRFSRLSQLRAGRWSVVSDYVVFSGLRGVQDKTGRWIIESEFFKGD